MTLPKATQPGRGRGRDWNTDSQLPWSRLVLGRAGFHPEPLLQLCTSVGLRGMRELPRSLDKEPGQGFKHPRQNNRRRFQGAGLAAQGQTWVPADCLLLPGSGSCIPKATPHPVTPVPPGWEARALGYCLVQLLPGG